MVVINNQSYFCWYLNKYSENYNSAKCFGKGKARLRAKPHINNLFHTEKQFYCSHADYLELEKKKVCKTHISFDFSSIHFYIKLKFVASKPPADNNDTCPRHPHNRSILENGTMPIERSPCRNSPQSSPE